MMGFRREGHDSAEGQVWGLAGGPQGAAGAGLALQGPRDIPSSDHAGLSGQKPGGAVLAGCQRQLYGTKVTTGPLGYLPFHQERRQRKGRREGRAQRRVSGGSG